VTSRWPSRLGWLALTVGVVVVGIGFLVSAAAHGSGGGPMSHVPPVSAVSQSPTASPTAAATPTAIVNPTPTASPAPTASPTATAMPVPTASPAPAFCRQWLWGDGWQRCIDP
ncbi:MAG: hypothetical protein ACYDCQ_20290, partial [Dehalococcoidia bacterium]